MNPIVMQTIFFFPNLKAIFRYLFYTFFFVLSLPVLSIMVVTNVGTDIISNAVATVEPINSSIQIFNPRDHSQVITIQRDRVKPTNGVTTLHFGESHLPYQVLHTGIDIANAQGKEGDPIVAFMNGKVTYIGDLDWGYGKHIIVDHGDNITTLYAHLSAVEVSVGDNVIMGETMGRMGNTGWSTGPHLHFEVRVYGIPVNPANFI